MRPLEVEGVLAIPVAAAMGLLLGSFLNVCIHRWPRDLSVVWPGSHCVVCRHRIAWYDNVPVASYAALGGRCRHCRTSISWRYAMVEATVALLFAAAVWRWGLTGAAAKFAVFGFLQVGMIFTDLETRLLPDQFTKGGMALGFVAAALLPLRGGFGELLWRGDPWVGSLIEAGLGAGVTSGVLWAMGWVYGKVRHREGLGFGDVKMVAMIGAFLGLGGALATLMIGGIAGTLIGLGYIYWFKKDASTFELPFGTFLGAAAIVVAYWRG
ncbi:MAG: prepilin peptidase [Bryobacteraceae bacterium]